MKYTSFLKLEPINTVTKKVYDKLLYAIISGIFKPGQRLLERELAINMEVSRTPIREALIYLQRQGLVISLPYKGMEVKKLSKEESLDVIEVCRLLEGLIAKSVAKDINNIDEIYFSKVEDILTEYKKALDREEFYLMKELNYKFHISIANMCKNKFAVEHYQSTRALMCLISAMVFSTSYEDENTYLEHKKIIEAIKSGDAILAERESVNHIGKVKQYIVSNGY